MNKYDRYDKKLGQKPRNAVNGIYLFGRPLEIWRKNDKWGVDGLSVSA